MVRGLYTAYTGMWNETKRLDIISNNLANSATVGYKEENVTSQAFDKLMTDKIRDGSEAYVNRRIGTMSPGVKIGEVYTDYGQGSLRETGASYDLAISGTGFFAVRMMDANGEETVRYTRNGSFKMTKDGYITDSDGNHLQASGGDLQVPVDASDVSVDQLGNVFADGERINRIELTDFSDYDYLKKYGENYYETVDGFSMTPATGLLEQGYTEQSNVNVVSEMVQMITITRAYEANQKVIQTEDSLLDKSVNSVGKVG